MFVGLKMLKEKKIDALISAGNTGALVLSSKIILGTFPKVLRPALLSMIPTKKSPLVALDLGANVQYKAKHLVQFASMASSYLQILGKCRPKIGLLNIGEEALKGTSERKLAHKELSANKFSFDFVGNVEGKSVFDGNIDALITDGFTGNIFLKTAEGVANLIFDKIQSKLSKDSPEDDLYDLKKHLHYSEYPGALLLGVKGIVVKCHGYSTPEAFVHAILEAAKLAQKNFVESFKNCLSESL